MSHTCQWQCNDAKNVAVLAVAAKFAVPCFFVMCIGEHNVHPFSANDDQDNSKQLVYWCVLV